jgi:alkylation response protein AidB-like acyl-CoA dehydrogenase
VDFSLLDLEGDDARLREEVQTLLAEYVTDEVREEVERTGSSFDARLCLAMGERGWILPDRSPEDGGAGLTPLQCELLELELDRADAPLMALGTTALILPAFERFGDPALVEELVPKVASGEVRFCLGYTEPDNGSDIAAAKTRAVRDGDEWVINGSKMFTTEAHHCQYSFLLTRTDREVPKHRGLTMFLVPLDTPGVEVQPIRTVGGERTNVVYYTDARIEDRYRLGAVNDGWRVLLGPLEAEHGTGGAAKQLGPLSNMGRIPIATLRRALDRAVHWATTASSDRALPIDDPGVRDRLAEIAIDLEAAASTPDPMGRIYASGACIRDCGELLSIVGPQALVARGEDGAIDDGVFDFSHRFAQGTAIYGGTVEIFKNIVAQHVLGLPRPLPPSR